LLIALVLIAVAVHNTTTKRGQNGGPSTTIPGSGTPGVTAPSPPGLKPVIRGLIDRNGAPPAGYPINAWVIQVNWADLQPQPSGPIASGNAIDKAVAQVRTMNAGGGHMALKLRVYAGINSPGWAKQLGGPPFPVVDNSSRGRSGMAPRFWTLQFEQAYAALQVALAARYDNVPEIREVVISQCSTVFDEPFERQVGDRGTRDSMLAAGYTFAADQACQQAEVNAHNAWKKTSSDLAFNPFQSPEGFASGNGKALDLTLPQTIMRYCRQQLGARCVLENNSLSAPPKSAYSQLYQEMNAVGPPITFQTLPPNRVGDLKIVLGLAADLGAASVELPVSYKQQPASTLASISSAAVVRLERNPAP